MTELVDMLRLQAGVCQAMGSPFSAGLLARAADAFSTEPSLRAVFAPWREADRRALFDHAVALRWLGAAREAALREPQSPLGLAYPKSDAPADPQAAWPHVLELMRQRADAVSAFMAHEPQTNEPRRSAVLLPGFLVVAERTGLPLRILELGASAGLNQLWDERRYRLGAMGRWGPEDAPLDLDIDWRGGPPPLDARTRVVERAACDRAPVDLADPDQRRRLRAYVWADQFDRLERLDAAIAQSLAAGVTVERADAVDWVAVHAAPSPGVATVVFHSVFFQYMPKASQTALVDSLTAFGARAAAEAPLAWLRMEPDPGHPATMELRLTLWPGGEDRLLATAHPHGAWIEWVGDQAVNP